MFCIGDHYYPEGQPTGSSACPPSLEFVDSSGKKFWIDYTLDQTMQNANRNGGMLCLYVPFMWG